MEKIVASAPGKVILHGEHSVVYGRRAVALSLDLRTTVTLQVNEDVVTIESPNVNINYSWPIKMIREVYDKLDCYKNIKQTTTAFPIPPEANDLLHKFLNISKEESNTKTLALISFFHLYFSILPNPLPIHVYVTSDLPTGAGLGSSAAYAVCISAAFLKLAKIINSDLLLPPNSKKIEALDVYDRISQWAYCSEQIVHGSPSGIDNSACTYGGGVSFKSGNITPIDVPPFEILLVNTKVPRNTKALVMSVRELRDKHPKIIEPILNSMDELAEKSLSILNDLTNTKTEKVGPHHLDKTSHLYGELYDLVDINHAQLSALGVSHPSLEKLVTVAKSYKLHAKLTGAGGGGLGFVLLGKEICREMVLSCRNELEKLGYEVWTTKLGAAGVTIH